jgi:hypothetical protein
VRMSCKTTVSWESKTNADYHDSSIADECSHGIKKKKKSLSKEQQAMKTTSDMQQSFFSSSCCYFIEMDKKHTLLSFDTHTHMSTPNGLFMIICCTKCRWKKGINDNTRFLLCLHALRDNNRWTLIDAEYRFGMKF